MVRVRIKKYRRRGYHRRGYRRRDGTYVKPAYVPPATVSAHYGKVWRLKKPITREKGTIHKKRRR